MYRIIDDYQTDPPSLTDSQRHWFGICDYISSHWYFIVTTDEFAELIRLRFSALGDEEDLPVNAKTVRNIYLSQFYNELYYRGPEEFSDPSNRDTQLSPIVDDDGIEYLVRNVVESLDHINPDDYRDPDDPGVDDDADDPDDMILSDSSTALINAVLTSHGNKKRYIPTVEEMEEYFEYGFHPSTMMEAFEKLTELFSEMDEKEQDHNAQMMILNTIRGLENLSVYDKVFEEVIKHFLPGEERVEKKKAAYEQLMTIYNNTHLPANKGYTPLQLMEYVTQT